MPETEQIAAIGAGRQMLALKSIGVGVYDAGDGDEALEHLRRLGNEPAMRLLLISEPLADRIGPDAISDVRTRTGTMIMVVPTHDGTSGVTQRWFKEAMEHSIGVDLISD